MYNSGKWTQARFNSFVKSVLRSGTRSWPPKWDVLNEAKTGKKVNQKTGRIAEHYRCAACNNEFPAKEVQVDHKDPIVPVSGFTNWDVVILNLFCEKEHLQVLCKTCHKLKSKEEAAQRKLHKNNNNKGE